MTRPQGGGEGWGPAGLVFPQRSPGRRRENRCVCHDPPREEEGRPRSCARQRRHQGGGEMPPRLRIGPSGRRRKDRILQTLQSGDIREEERCRRSVAGGLNGRRKAPCIIRLRPREEEGARRKLITLLHSLRCVRFHRSRCGGSQDPPGHGQSGWRVPTRLSGIPDILRSGRPLRPEPSRSAHSKLR